MTIEWWVMCVASASIGTVEKVSAEKAQSEIRYVEYLSPVILSLDLGTFSARESKTSLQKPRNARRRLMTEHSERMSEEAEYHCTQTCATNAPDVFSVYGF